jgi:hypothetical protein
MKSAEKTDSKAHPEVGTTSDGESSGDGTCACTCNTEKGIDQSDCANKQTTTVWGPNPNPKDVDWIFYRNSKTFWSPNPNPKDVDCIFYRNSKTF